MEEKVKQTGRKQTTESQVEVNPLRKQKVYVRLVPKRVGGITDPKHPLFDGAADGSTFKYCVPILRSTGKYKNVLTDAEKDYLEKALSLDYNALSVYKAENNYWDNYYVLLTKEGMVLDLSEPDDYIKYKVLLANKDAIAPSVQERIDRPKNTYRFELVMDGEETDMENAKLNATMESYKLFGKIEEDKDTLRTIVELLDGRPYDSSTKLDFFRSRCSILIQANPKAFLAQITDPLLHTKMLIRRGVELGKLSKRGDYYYLKSDGSPLCDSNEDPTLSIAARYLNQPSHQDIKFLIESAVEESRK